MPPFTTCFNPEFNYFLSIADSFFVGVTVRFAPWQFGHGDNIRVIRDTPLNHHRIVIVLITHLAPLLTF